MTQTVHIIGCGLAGLSSAVHLRKLGRSSILYDAAPKAGGRVRAVQADTPYDNGTHLLIKGYRDTFEYLDLINSRDSVQTLTPSAYNFVEPKRGKRWSLPGHCLIRAILKGKIPSVNVLTFWHSVAYKRLWDPLALAIFNTETKAIDRPLVRSTFKELIKQGRDSATPYCVDATLYDSLIAPALAHQTIHYGHRLRAINSRHLSFRTHDCRRKPINPSTPHLKSPLFPVIP